MTICSFFFCQKTSTMIRRVSIFPQTLKNPVSRALDVPENHDVHDPDLHFRRLTCEVSVSGANLGSYPSLPRRLC